MPDLTQSLWATDASLHFPPAPNGYQVPAAPSTLPLLAGRVRCIRWSRAAAFLLPCWSRDSESCWRSDGLCSRGELSRALCTQAGGRSEEHTSVLQSPCNLVCRLLLGKKQN